MKKSHAIDLLENHQLLFSYLSEVFLNEPDEEFIHQMITQKLYFSFPFESEDEGLQKGLNLLRNFSIQWEKVQIHALRDEYFRLFHGIEKMLVPPYESVYLSREHLLFEKETLQVREFYSTYGLRIDKLNIIPDDHIGYQLLFIAYLVKLTVEAIQTDKEKDFEKIKSDTLSFLSDHPLKWVDSFTELLYKHSPGFYFRGNGMLLKFLICQIREDLNSLNIS
jgi:putative dimethyl sulfoxide reductase chaperone